MTKGMKFLVTLSLLFCLVVLPVQAAERLRVVRVESVDRILLSDGQTIKLAGVKAPREADLSAAALASLEKLCLNHTVFLAGTAPDRLGRTLAQLYAVDDSGQRQWVQAVWVREGAVFVAPSAESAEYLPVLFAQERQARAAGAGVWSRASYRDLPATEARRAIGSYAFVTGKLVDFGHYQNKIYLNFGPDSPRDFTASFDESWLRAFKKAGLDLDKLVGHTLRVRGLVESYIGPTMLITVPDQVEVLD